MTVRFQCPDCEWLEVDDEDIGNVVVCPYCLREVAVPLLAQSDEPIETSQSQESSESDTPSIYRSKKVSIDVDVRDDRNSKSNPFSIDDVEMFHISCKKGFVMEVPRDMIGTEALCPCCEQRMVLNLRDTYEYQRKQQWEQEREEIRLGKFWLQTAIVVASLVVFGIVLMLLMQFI